MTDGPAQPADQPEAETYEICVRGYLDAGWAARLAVPSLTHETDGTTVLRGIAADQAGLHGLLQRVRDLGLTLVSVMRIDPATTLPPAPPTNPRRPK